MDQHADVPASDPLAAPARVLTRRLAQSLRDLATDLVDRDLPEQTVGELLAAVESLHATAVGPRRVRYYEAGDLEVARGRSSTSARCPGDRTRWPSP